MTGSDLARPDLAGIAASIPLAAELGIELAEATAERVTATLAWRRELCTVGGVLHGGALMALADTAGAVCAFLNLPDGATGTSTIESKTNFFRPVTAGAVTAAARSLHAGGTTIVVEVTLTRQDGKAVGHTVQTQAVLRPR